MNDKQRVVGASVGFVILCAIVAFGGIALWGFTNPMAIAENYLSVLGVTFGISIFVVLIAGFGLVLMKLVGNSGPWNRRGGR